jgi:transposase
LLGKITLQASQFQYLPFFYPTFSQELGIDEQEIVNSGEIVKAIILNGLGFVSQPLYLFPKFSEDKATEHLLGNGILPGHLNGYKIGRVMGKLYDYGLS